MERILNYIAPEKGKVQDILKMFDFSTSILRQLKREVGLVTVNGEPVFLTYFVNVGDKLMVKLVETPERVVKYDKAVNIVFEDEDVAVIDKTADIAVIATHAHYGVSLMNALANVWGDFVFHAVNRLDKGTSGLMLVAKNTLAHSILSRGMEGDVLNLKADMSKEFNSFDSYYENLVKTNKNSVVRVYLAIVGGKLVGDGIVNSPIGQVDLSKIERSVMSDGKSAKTYFKTILSCEDFSLVKIVLETGRTHQIRVHMKELGHPLLGDSMYGGNCDLIKRPALHSCNIFFNHPFTKKTITLESNLPIDMQDIVDKIK